MPQKNKETRSFFQWINFFIPYLYTIGIILIVAWMFAASLRIGIETLNQNPNGLFLLSEDPSISDSTTGNQSLNDSWLNVLIKPIVESDFNKVIFRGLFLLLVWMLLFLAIPVAFKKLKRLKLFNMEIEVGDIEQAAIETIEVSASKAKYMLYLTSDAVADRTIEILDDNGLNFQEVLESFLAEIQEWFLNAPLEASFSYEIYTGLPPSKLNKLIEASKESASSVVQNKTDPNNLTRQNYFVFYFPYWDIEYTTVISSYTHAFDYFDQYLFETLHNIISKNVENYEFMVALTSSNDSET